MNVLAIDCSGTVGSACLVDNRRQVYEVNWDKKNSHADVLHSYINELLVQSDLHLSGIDCFALNNGPGSFTGIRVGLSTVKSFAYSFQKPIYSCNSLDILSRQTTAPQEVAPLLCGINAQRNEIFYKIYDFDGACWRAQDDDILIAAIKDIPSIVKDRFYYSGNAANIFQHLRLEDRIINFSEHQKHPLAKTNALLCKDQDPIGQTLDWKSVLALYIRPSAAEEKLGTSI